MDLQAVGTLLRSWKDSLTKRRVVKPELPLQGSIQAELDAVRPPYEPVRLKGDPSALSVKHHFSGREIQAQLLFLPFMPYPLMNEIAASPTTREDQDRKNIEYLTGLVINEPFSYKRARPGLVVPEKFCGQMSESIWNLLNSIADWKGRTPPNGRKRKGRNRAGGRLF